jgi:hypothetical protein
MQTEFPKSDKNYLNAKDFQDNEKIVTYRGWERKANEDRPAKGKMAASTWQQNLKYCLKYTYPEMAIDPMTAQQRLDSKGQPFKNSNYLPEYPHGYTIVYHFDEGLFESGSSPFYEKFKSLQPKPGETLVISKTGLKENTKWAVNRVKNAFPQDVPDLDADRDFSSPEFNADPNPEDEPLPF